MECRYRRDLPVKHGFNVLHPPAHRFRTLWEHHQRAQHQMIATLEAKPRRACSEKNSGLLGLWMPAKDKNKKPAASQCGIPTMASIVQRTRE